MAVRGFVGVPVTQVMQRLFVIRAANFQITTDQPFTQVFQGTKWDPQTIVANQVSGAFSVSCTGGIYMGAGKTGAIITPASQSYSTLTGANTQQNCAISAFTTTFTGTPILSLTGANGAALTADVFIYGFCFD